MKKVILADAGDAEGLWPRCWVAGGEPARALEQAPVQTMEELVRVQEAVAGLDEALVPGFGNNR